MKKKFLAFLLCAATALSLTACGGPNKGASGLRFEVIVKSYQSTYWGAAVQGVEKAAKELGVQANTTGPSVESAVQEQIDMIKNAIASNPDGIAIAACDTQAVLECLELAQEKNIPVVCFDTGVEGAPEGSVYATVATDNIAAGACAAEHMYPVIRDKVLSAAPDAQVRIGEVNQDAVALNIQQRGMGFVNKMVDQITEDGKKVAIVGNTYYVDLCSGENTVAEAEADVIIEIGVPSETTVLASKSVAGNILSKPDTIAIFGSNQVTAEGIIGANETLNVLSADAAKGIVAVGFDAGRPQKEAINAGLFLGSVTQSPLMMGYDCIQVLYKISQGEAVEDIAMNGYWYDTKNMTNDNIAPNLYD